MYRNYMMKNGNILHTWVSEHSDVRTVVIYDDSFKEVANRYFSSDDPDPTFSYHGELFHVDNYIYDDVDTFASKVEACIQNNNRRITESEFVAMMLKQSDVVGIQMEVAVRTPIPGLGISFKDNSNFISTLMVPVERQYTKQDWGYKIEFDPSDPNMQSVVGSETYYTSDLLSMILDGTFKLVNLNKFSDDLSMYSV